MAEDPGTRAYDKLGRFLAEYPLYRDFDLGELWDERNLTNPGRVISTPKIYRHCEHPRCEMERPFDSVNVSNSPDGRAFHEEPDSFQDSESSGGRLFYFSFRCTGCNSSVFRCYVETVPEYSQPGSKRIRKVGQTPAWNISLPKSLRKAFGKDAELYKNARECMSHSYGMASCAYLRRIVEDQIDLLLEILLEVRTSEGANAEVLREIQNAQGSREIENKTKVADKALPESVRIADDNVLYRLYDHLSGALHRREDQECMKIAEAASVVLERIVTENSAARRQLREREEYEEILKSLE